MGGIVYPTVDDIIEVNKIVLQQVRAKRGDAHSVKSRIAIETTLAEAKAKHGDIFDKAAVIFIGLIKKHAFGSANRRTAWTVTDTFLITNGEELRARYNGRVVIGIREGFYTPEEVKSWLQGHEIREFRRW